MDVLYMLWLYKLILFFPIKVLFNYLIIESNLRNLIVAHNEKPNSKNNPTAVNISTKPAIIRIEFIYFFDIIYTRVVRLNGSLIKQWAQYITYKNTI